MIEPNSNQDVSLPVLPERLAFIEGLVSRDGPEPDEYSAFTDWINALASDIRDGKTSRDAVRQLWKELTAAHFRGSLQGMVVEVPHGYHGDFEVIDGIHKVHISTDPKVARWDAYLQNQAAPKAVRNRKKYFHDLLQQAATRENKRVSVLNIASGPSRDVHEWFLSEPSAEITFDCVDLDKNAILFATRLLSTHAEKVRFFHCNALTFKPDGQYDLVWSAGLFDYLEDRLFVRLLKRMIRFAKCGGEVVIGNFGDFNPTRNYMEMLGGWKLIHRSAEELRSLAVSAGAANEQIRIGMEPEKVNFFLHVCKPAQL